MQNTSRILITGASGFVGSGLTRRLIEDNFVNLKVALRNTSISLPLGVVKCHVPSIDGNTDWSEGVLGTHIVVHIAAHVHVLPDSSSSAQRKFNEVNFDGTINLARQASAAGVRRFIFISSIKVNGEKTQLNRPFTAEDVPMPMDQYGASKYQAELGLLKLSAQSGMEVVILRPTLVYGQGVKMNFFSLLKWVSKGIPLPLKNIYNTRSFLALDNLLDVIVICLQHPRAAGQIFLVSDGDDVSTSELLRKCAHAMGRRAYLFSLPESLLRKLAKLIGKSDWAERLLGSLQVDIDKTKLLLDWTPKLSLEQGLKKLQMQSKGYEASF